MLSSFSFVHAENGFVLDCNADSSENNYGMKTHGDVIFDNIVRRFGDSSAYFDGSDAFISIEDSSSLNLEDDLFTIDFWFRIDELPNENSFIVLAAKHDTDLGREWTINLFNDEGKYKMRFQFSVDGSDYLTVSYPWNPELFKWYHFALVRQSPTDTRIYINGKQLGWTYDSDYTIFSSDRDTTLGADTSAGNPRAFFAGHIDEFRLIKGEARWTSEFVPPSSAYRASVEDILFNFDTFASKPESWIKYNGNILIYDSDESRDESQCYFDGNVNHLSIQDMQELEFLDKDFRILIKGSFALPRISMNEIILAKWNEVGSKAFMLGRDENERIFFEAIDNEGKKFIDLLSELPLDDIDVHEIVIQRKETKVQLMIDDRVQAEQEGVTGGVADNDESFTIAATYNFRGEPALFFRGYIGYIEIVLEQEEDMKTDSGQQYESVSSDTESEVPKLNMSSIMLDYENSDMSLVEVRFGLLWLKNYTFLRFL